jgi:GntR family transcriptional regulator
MTILRLQSITEQVEKLLRERIRNRNYAPDGRLPSEAELAEEYAVSRATVRSALSVLASEQLIIRKTGIGTFVNEHINELSPNFDSLWEHSYLIEQLGKAPSIETLSTSIRSAKEDEAKALDISVGGKVYVLERLFLADGQPIVYSYNIIPIRLFQSDLADMETNIEIRIFMERYCRQELSYVIADLTSTLPTDSIVKALRLEENTPVLHFSQVFYTASSLPAVYADNYYNDKLLRLRIARAINLSSQEVS